MLIEIGIAYLTGSIVQTDLANLEPKVPIFVEEPLRLTSSKFRDARPSFGPEGRIVFTSDRDGDHELYVMDSDGSNLKQLTFNKGSDCCPSWGPSGRIAYVYSPGNVPWSSIRTIKPDGSDIQELSEFKGEVVLDTLAWGPNNRIAGNVVLFENPTLKGGIYIFYLDGRKPVQISRLGNGLVYSWSSDNILYLTDDSPKGSQSHIFAIEEDGSARRRVSTDDTNAIGPASGPDGRIAFWSRNGRFSDIKVMDPDGTNIKVVVNHRSKNFQPSFGPNGQIAFVSDRDGNAEMYVVRVPERIAPSSSKS